MTGTSAGSEHQAEHFERLYMLVFGNASLIEREKKSALGLVTSPFVTRSGLRCWFLFLLYAPVAMPRAEVITSCNTQRKPDNHSKKRWIPRLPKVLHLLLDSTHLSCHAQS